MPPYWQRQDPAKPLFPDIEWNRPEQKTRAGKLLIIGGSSLGFLAVAESYQLAIETGAGQVKALLPDILKKNMPSTLSDTVFVPSNPSGGISKEASNDINAAQIWCDHILLIGDAGRNSETAAVYEQILTTEKPLTISRDAVDLLRPVSGLLMNRPNTYLVVSFAQLQKLFQAVYYPKILSFSMPLNLLIEILHKFTITYPVTIVTFHQDKLITAHKGDIITQLFTEPTKIWRGSVATRLSCYLSWTPNKPLEAIATSFV